MRVEGHGYFLIYAPFGKDGQHLCKVLQPEGTPCIACSDLVDLVAHLDDNALLLLTTEELFASPDLPLLVATLKRQPPWSALPVIVFYSPRGVEPSPPHFIHELTDVSLLPRPVTSVTLLSAVRAAVRDRLRQYRTGELLAQLQRDIERRAVQEEELKQAKAAADAANLSKTQFLANMSHEIRTPLGAILGFADLLAMPETTRQDRQHYVSVIRRNSKQLLRIIDDILDLAKVESGKIQFEILPITLRELLSDCISLLRLRALENGIELQMHEATALPAVIESDPTRLKQILINVVGNAIKFTVHGRVDVRVSYQDGSLTFEVKDTGRGISPEQSALLFRPFVQADASTKRQFGGTGLGLVLTRRLCQAMGGDFFLKESELGKGSTFVARVQAKVAQERPGGGDTAERTDRLLVGRKILLVEDSLDNQELIRAFLARAGAQVDLASDGIDGVEKALRGAYEAIVMDIQMPRMDGLEAVRVLRESGLRLPIVALSAHAMKEESDRCLQAGFSCFLAKPVRNEELVQLVHGLIAGATQQESQPATRTTAP